MKKIIALACLFLLLPVSASFAADPLKAHEAGFGPEILGLQLGKHMTWAALIDAEKKICATRPTTEPPEMVTMPNGDRISLEAPPFQPAFAIIFGDNYKALYRDGRDPQTGKRLTLNHLTPRTILVVNGDSGTLSKVPKSGNLDELFAMLKKRGLNYAATPHVVVRDERVVEYVLDKTNFPTKAATAEEFAQWLSAKYALGALEKKGRNYESRNPPEGWRVVVTEEKVQVFSMPIPDNSKK